MRGLLLLHLLFAMACGSWHRARPEAVLPNPGSAGARPGSGPMVAAIPLPPKPPSVPSTAPPRPTIAPAWPAAERGVLFSGLRLLVVPRPGSTLVALGLQIATGAQLARPGLAQLTGMLVADGAAAEEVGARAFSLQAGAETVRVQATPFSTTFSQLVLPRKLPDSLAHMAAMVRGEGLRKAGFATLRGREMALADARSRDAASRVAVEIFRRMAPGQELLDARLGSAATLRELSRIRHRDCERFYRAAYGPQSATLVIVGDVTLAKVRPWVASAFGSWKPQSPALAPAPLRGSPGKRAKGLRVYLIDQPQAPEVLLAVKLRFGQLERSAALMSVLQASLGTGAVLHRAGGKRSLVHWRSLPLAEVLEEIPKHGFAGLQRLATPSEQRLARAAQELPMRLAAAEQRPAMVLQWWLQTRLSPARWRSTAGALPPLWRKIGNPLEPSSNRPPVVVVIGDADKLRPALAGLAPLRLLDPRGDFSPLGAARSRRK